LLITIAFLAYLLFTPAMHLPSEVEAVAGPPAVVRVVGPDLLAVEPESTFARRLQVAEVRAQSIAEPVLTVTGKVVASRRPGMGKDEDFWQFDAPEVLTAYTDWEKAQADITFAEAQLASMKELAAARLDAQNKLVERLAKLVKAGTDTARDLAAEKANLIQVEIQGKREIHEAETAVRVARRAEAASARILQQSGLDPQLLRTATADMDLVQADVPEGRLNRVRIGQSCLVTFFGLPGRRFQGKVNGIAPVLSRERRSLRVMFLIDDPKDELRPGMFAEIGLGTDPREALLAPADAVLHVGRGDYLLVNAGDHRWRIVEVQVGEPYNGDVQILDGVRAGDRVVGRGAILFKPFVVRALQEPPPPAREDGQ
jgi:multidrug efflux pump subunit AcrA (membrane-fusion protein)